MRPNVRPRLLVTALLTLCLGLIGSACSSDGGTEGPGATDTSGNGWNTSDVSGGGSGATDASGGEDGADDDDAEDAGASGRPAPDPRRYEQVSAHELEATRRTLSWEGPCLPPKWGWGP